MRTRQDFAERRKRVLELIAKGLTQRIVAERVGVTPAAVAAIVANEKLRIASQLEAKHE